MGLSGWLPVRPFKSLLGQPEDHTPDPGPIDGARAHGARLCAHIQREMLQLARLVTPGGPACGHRLGMGGGVPHWDQTEIPLLDHDVSGIVDEDAPEGQVALLSRADGDLEGGPQASAHRPHSVLSWAILSS